MLKIAIKIGLQLLLVAAPLFTMEWSLLDWGGVPQTGANHYVVLHVMGHALMQGPKAEVEFRLRAVMSTLALAGLFIYEAAEFYIPREGLRNFRKEFLELEAAEWRTQLGP